MRLDDAIPAGQVEADSMASPEYRTERDRTRLANEVALRVLGYRHEHGLSQSAFARLIGMCQPTIARLEASDHEPSMSMLSRLSAVLGEPFTIDVDATGAHLHAT